MCQNQVTEDNKAFLNDIEKKKLIDTTEVIYNVFNELAEKKKKSKWAILKHPLVALIVGCLLSGFIVFYYQTGVERSVEKAKAKFESIQSVVKDIFEKSGSVLSNAKVIVNIHLEAITDDEQIIDANKAYNSSYKAFYASFYSIQFRIRAIFAEKNIEKLWENIKIEIDDLDKSLLHLADSETNEVTENHSENISKCSEKINSLAIQLKSLYKFVSKHYEENLGSS